MATRWRRAMFAVVVVVAVASGWVYPYIRQQQVAPVSPDSTLPPERMSLWHGRVTQIREMGGTAPGDRQCLVEYPVRNVYQKREYIARMWFCVQPGTVTDRRTGQPGELAVGQRVSILWHGLVAETDPPHCRADEVWVEPDVLPLAQP